jgi:hypothetical protein
MRRNSRVGDRAFIIVVYDDGAESNSFSVVDALRPTIRRSRHGMMIIGDPNGTAFACALFQECSKDRVPAGPARWIGPINSEDDAEALRGWIEDGIWEDYALPIHLRCSRTGIIGSSGRSSGRR